MLWQKGVGVAVGGEVVGALRSVRRLGKLVAESIGAEFLFSG